MELPRLADQCGLCKSEKAEFIVADKVQRDSVCKKCLGSYKFPESLLCYVCGKKVEVKQIAVIDNVMLITCSNICQSLLQQRHVKSQEENVSDFLRKPCYVCKDRLGVKQVQAGNKKFGICAQCPDTNIISKEYLECWTCHKSLKTANSGYSQYEMTYSNLNFKFLFCCPGCLKIHKKEMEKNMSNCFVCDTPTTQKCARCHVTYYCSQACQKKDWGSHKKKCNN